MHAIFWNGGIKFGPSGDTNLVSRSVGPYKIAHWVRKHGYQAQVIDFVTMWTEDELYVVTKKFITNETRVIGLSTTFIANNIYIDSSGRKRMIPEHVTNCIIRIKKEYPQIKFVLGGYMSEYIGSFGHVDATVMNYTSATEDIFLEYLKHLVDGSEPPIGTLVFPRFSSASKPRIHFNAARNPLYNIETDDFRFIPQDCILPNEPLPLDVSRGCIFACKFCQYPHIGKGKLDYIRGMQYLEEEMLTNYSNFGTTHYYVLDDTFNDTETKLKAFYEMTQRLPFKITYTTYIRADLVHRFPDMAYLLQESGMFGAVHGIESFHPEASKVIGKAWSGKVAKDFLPKLFHDIWQKKIAMQNNFIVGLPHDTEQNLLDTVAWHNDNAMHFINFSALGVSSPDDNRNGYTIQSEFDRNAEKYGFTFQRDPATGNITWTNNNWSSNRAVEFTRTLKGLTKGKNNKLSAWTAPALQWYGYNQDYLLTTPFIDTPWGEISNKTNKLYLQYYQLLMSI